MARKYGIRIWRYSVAKNSWKYRSKKHPGCDLQSANVNLPDGGPTPLDGDFLFEDLDATGQSEGRIPQNISKESIFGVVPNRLVSDSSDVWFVSTAERAFERIYTRRGSKEDKDTRKDQQKKAIISAALPQDAAAQGLDYVVILQSETRAIILSKKQSAEEVELDVEEGILS